MNTPLEVVGQVTIVVFIILVGAFGVIGPLVKFEEKDENGYHNSDWLFIPLFTILLTLGVLGIIGYNNLATRPVTPSTLHLIIPGLGDGNLSLNPQGEGGVAIPRTMQSVPNDGDTKI
jgi:hypothetical protein